MQWERGNPKGGGKGDQKGGGKGYQGVCWDCWQAGHKRGEAACPKRIQGVKGVEAGSQKDECAVSIGGVWIFAAGKAPVLARWVDANNGGSEKVEIRSRLVAQEHCGLKSIAVLLSFPLVG